MTAAVVLGDSDVRLWGLSSRQRLQRQFRQIDGIDVVGSVDAIPAGETKVLLIRAEYLFEVKTIGKLGEHDAVFLRCRTNGGLAAAVTVGADAERAAETLLGNDAGGQSVIEPAALEDYDHTLRKTEAPLLEPVVEDNKEALQSRLYGGAYKGITDLVTKFLWPRPVKPVVRWCASNRITPNMVTMVGIGLVIYACFAFLDGNYWAGLAAGWVMTFLDTVDGKLARVTVASSKLGHYLDHVTDILHPPFWYVFWGMSLVNFDGVIGFSAVDLYWMIGIGYVVGRLIEAVFHLLGSCSIFSWRPFDAYFRLVTGRRNPSLIIFTAAMLLGRPDWGFVGVAFWTGGTTVLLALRLIYAVVVRASSGPLTSWLTDADTARTQNARAYAIFSSTRSAYGAA